MVILKQGANLNQVILNAVLNFKVILKFALSHALLLLNGVKGLI